MRQHRSSSGRARRGGSVSLGFSLSFATLVLAGCGDMGFRRPAPESAPILVGPAASSNSTPLDSGFECFRQRLGERPSMLSIGVGEVRDYTGKSSINEGAILTQGGSLMVISALGKLRPALRVHERFDPRVGELELIYTDRRQLGDGRSHLIPDGRAARQVPWLPYMGGSILQSDYYIVGGITELNYSIQSGGFTARINNIGPQARTFTLNIAADLRIVNTRNLVVAHTVSLQKQVIGHQVDGDIFRFFGSRLIDVNIGTRNLEPIQLAARVILELGVMELISHVSSTPLEGCLQEAIDAGLVSTAYRPPEFPMPEPAPAPVTPMPPPVSDTPSRSTPRRQSAAPPRSDTAPAARPSPTGRPAAEAPAAPVTNAPLPPLAPANALPMSGGADPSLRRPDAELRPAIPSWLEQPGIVGTGSQSPRSLMAPTPTAPTGRINGSSLAPSSGLPGLISPANAAPAPAPEPTPQPAQPINVLGQNEAPMPVMERQFASMPDAHVLV